MQTIDRKRLLAAGGDSLAQWFNDFEQVRNQYAIQPADLWNMDDSGFAIAEGRNQTVIAPVDGFQRNKFKPKLDIAENGELVTVIEGISASGNYIEPFVIFKGINHIATMYGDGRDQSTEAQSTDDIQVPVSWYDDWTFGISPAGYTNDELGYKWIQQFHTESAKKQVGEYRLLLVDGHGSHTTRELLEFCESRKIIVFGFPPHSTHLLQPCDVGLFGPYKQHFATAVDDAVRHGYTQFGKREFTNLLAIARKKTMKASTITSAFKRAGIEPLDAQIPIEAALKSLPPRPQTPPPRETGVPTTPLTVRRTEKLGLWLRNECVTRPHDSDFDLERFVQFSTFISRVQFSKVTTSEQPWSPYATLGRRKKPQNESDRSRSIWCKGGGILTGKFARSVVRAKQDSATLADQRRLNRAATRAANSPNMLVAMDELE